MKKILITGAAGFIGGFLCSKILESSTFDVVGLDNLNDYYDVSIKEERLKRINSYENFTFVKGDISEKQFVMDLFSKYHFDIVVNLAAQAGVRYSIDHPDTYIQSNIIGFYNILEACRQYSIEHLIYASSSSVYGSNSKIPYSIEDKVDHPVSLYAATKKCDELLAHAYSKLYGLPTTGLRFFTVYGPLGRPDMAYFSFTNRLIKGQTIEIFNYGNCQRDFTYIDDIVDGILKVIDKAPKPSLDKNGLAIPPYKIYNIGNGHPVNLLDFVNILQEELIYSKVLPANYNFDAHKKFVPMQKGDVPITYADTSGLEKDFNYKPSTSLREGIRKFAEWYYEFYILRERK